MYEILVPYCEHILASAYISNIVAFACIAPCFKQINWIIAICFIEEFLETLIQQNITIKFIFGVGFMKNLNAVLLYIYYI